MTGKDEDTEVHVVGAAIIDGGRCLVTRRSATMSAPLKWEFPGGKVEVDEDPRDALRREVREELDIDIEVQRFLGRGQGRVGQRSILLDVYSAIWIGRTLRLTEHHELGWFTAEELDDLDWPEADYPLLPAVKAAISIT
jgi:8-oxo-dGTP diphosphatase